MKITAIKTPIVKPGEDLKSLIKDSIPSLPERSVLIITSKIVSYAQNRFVEKGPGDSKEVKHELVKQEADAYLPAVYSQYNMMLAIKEHTLTVNAGVDESNADGRYLLWPEKMQQVVDDIWLFLSEEYQLQEVGVIMTDSRTWPLRWGVVGTALVHSGFKQLTDYRGTEDLFGREIKMVQVNVAEALAVAAALEMGEVAEQTPLAIVENIKQIQFQDRVPTQGELDELHIRREDDVYGPFLTAVDWVEKE